MCFFFVKPKAETAGGLLEELSTMKCFVFDYVLPGMLRIIRSVFVSLLVVVVVVVVVFTLNLSLIHI